MGVDFKVVQANAEKGKYGGEIVEDAKGFVVKTEKLVKTIEKLLFGEATNKAAVPNLIVSVEAMHRDYEEFIQVATRFAFFIGEKKKVWAMKL